jgi:predicted MFS family arabinose efflux permease
MIASYLRKLRTFSRDARLFLITYALWGGFFGIHGVLFNLYLLRLGYGPAFVGWVNGVGRLVFGLSSLPAGAFGGRWGNRRMIVAGMCFGVLGFGLLPLVELFPVALRQGWVLAAFSLGWLGGSLYVVNGNPFLMGATCPDERNHAFSVREAFMPLAGFVGSLVGGLLPALLVRAFGLSLDRPAPYRYPLLLAAALLLPGIPMLLATREAAVGQRQQRATQRSDVPYGTIALLAVVILLWSTRIEVTFYNVYLDAGLRVPTSLIGVLMAVGKALTVPSVLLFPLLLKRWGPFRSIVAGMLGMATCLLPLALLPHWGAASLGYVGATALGLIVRPAFTVYTQEIVPPRSRGLMSGASTMASGLSASAMALGGGYLISAFGFPSLFLTGAGLTVIGAWILWSCFRTPRRMPLRSTAREGQPAS